MIYLKFMVPADKGSTIASETIECSRYHTSIVHDRGKGLLVDVMANDISYLVGDVPGGWLNCFVMSETGKTIDKIDCPRQKA